jgi:hypothetical protein
VPDEAYWKLIVLTRDAGPVVGDVDDEEHWIAGDYVTWLWAYAEEIAPRILCLGGAEPTTREEWEAHQ